MISNRGLNRFTDATMSCLPRIYLSIVAILVLLAILSASAQGERVNSVYREENDYFGNIDLPVAVCKSRLHHRAVRVHSKCKVDVSSRRCIGYCRTATDFKPAPFRRNESYLVLQQHCSCCKPIDVAKYKIGLFACYEWQGRDKVKTGEQVKISFPYEIKCGCSSQLKCRKFQNPWL